MSILGQNKMSKHHFNVESIQNGFGNRTKGTKTGHKLEVMESSKDNQIIEKKLKKLLNTLLTR